MKNKSLKLASGMLMTFFLGISIFGCGGGGSSAPSSTVSGVAATGAPMSGTIFLKDAANNPEMNQPINAQNGSFSFNVSGRTAPFMLRAGSLYSMSGGPGTANVNPLTNLMVADMGGFSNMSSMNTFYTNSNGPTFGSLFGNMSTARLHLRQKMGPLMSTYGVLNADPIAGTYTIGQGMDRMFDDVKMTIDANGKVSMMYVTGTPVFTGQMGNMAGGTMMSGNIRIPTANPVVNGMTITPGVAKLQVNATQQFTASIPSVTWSMVSQNGGSITSGGLYTAPPLQGMFLVKATSLTDPSNSATVTILVGRSGMMM